MLKQDDVINVAVTGDVNVDWNLKISSDPNVHNLWKADREKGLIGYSFGSAVQLGRLVHETLALAHGSKVNVSRVTESSLSLERFDVWDHLINGFELREGWKGWRQTRSMGRQYKRVVQPSAAARAMCSEDAQSEILVIDDKRFGYRDDVERWMGAFEAPTWIVLRMARELCKGKLWDTLSAKYAHKLIVVVTVKDLLDKDIHAERELSWEQAVDDIIRGLSTNEDLKVLGGMFSTVVLFDDAGALQFFGATAGRTAGRRLLCFDPQTFQFSADDLPGRVSGFAYTFIAAITNVLVESLLDTGTFTNADVQTRMTDDKWRTALTRGTYAMKVLNENGFVEDETRLRLEFPFHTIAAAILAGEAAHKFIELDSFVNAADWSILRQTVTEITKRPHQAGVETTQYPKARTVLDLALQVARQGFESAFPAVPYLQCGDLLSIDRREIQSLRSLQQIMSHYLEQEEPRRKPLCIAVFGEPGSGKSFAVKQLAAAIDPDQSRVGKPLTFNLSQFSNADALVEAWHQVRDEVIRGVTPLVFWDEFDSSLESTKRAWLRYFLAPMQDGMFQQGQITHPIGDAIFVFAGGISTSMDNFRQNDGADYKDTKIPDFISRLHGFLNVAGINAPLADGDRSDELWVIRRAIVIRASCLRYWRKNIFTNDSGHEEMQASDTLLRALLGTAKYEHGARSLDAIISSCRLSRSTKFNSSALPPPPLLDIHIKNLQDFRTALSPTHIFEQG